MRIVAAAIKYRLKSDPTTERYVQGPNHAYCIEWFSCADIPQRDRVDGDEQGFMTDAGDFVDRRAAYDIAEKAGQLRSPRADRTLYSEFVDYTKQEIRNRY